MELSGLDEIKLNGILGVSAGRRIFSRILAVHNYQLNLDGFFSPGIVVMNVTLFGLLMETQNVCQDGVASARELLLRLRLEKIICQLVRGMGLELSSDISSVRAPTENIFFVGTMAGIKIYVDVDMLPDDNRMFIYGAKESIVVSVSK